jgi:hypothetical protein
LDLSLFRLTRGGAICPLTAARVVASFARTRSALGNQGQPLAMVHCANGTRTFFPAHTTFFQKRTNQHPTKIANLNTVLMSTTRATGKIKGELPCGTKLS